MSEVKGAPASISRSKLSWSDGAKAVSIKSAPAQVSSKGSVANWSTSKPGKKSIDGSPC